VRKEKVVRMLPPEKNFILVYLQEGIV